MAEKQFGWGQETNDFIYLNVGTGLAAGFVVDGPITQGGTLTRVKSVML